MAFIEGKIGKARVALLVVTIEEFDLVSRLFGLSENIGGTPYFTARKSGAIWDVMLRRCPSQTNVISERTAGEFIEDFRPEFILLIGTAGGCQGRDHLQLGDIVVADFIDYSGYWKFDAGRVLARKNPHDHPSLFLHQSFIERLRVQSDEWEDLIDIARPVAGRPKLHIGNLVSGDVLLEMFPIPNSSGLSRTLTRHSHSKWKPSGLREQFLAVDVQCTIILSF